MIRSNWLYIAVMFAVSYTIRTRLAAGEGCEAELPEAVRAVIRREKLYKKEVSANEPQTGKGACARPLER